MSANDPGCSAQPENRLKSDWFVCPADNRNGQKFRSELRQSVASGGPFRGSNGSLSRTDLYWHPQSKPASVLANVRGSRVYCQSPPSARREVILPKGDTNDKRRSLSHSAFGLMIPCISSTLAIAKPIPLPSWVRLRVLGTRLNRSNNLGMASAGIPTPVSRTRSSAVLPTRCTLTPISPSKVNLKALEIKFRTIFSVYTIRKLPQIAAIHYQSQPPFPWQNGIRSPTQK